MAHSAHHDDHVHEKNHHDHAPADPKKVKTRVIAILILFFVLSAAGHYTFIVKQEGAHEGAAAAHGKTEDHQDAH